MEREGVTVVCGEKVNLLLKFGVIRPIIVTLTQRDVGSPGRQNVGDPIEPSGGAPVDLNDFRTVVQNQAYQARVLAHIPDIFCAFRPLSHPHQQ